MGAVSFTSLLYIQSGVFRKPHTFIVSHIGRAQKSVVVETYKIRVNASMVRARRVELLMPQHLGLNQAPIPIRVRPHNALFFTGVHRCANQPGMVYIYEKLIHIKPRLVLTSSDNRTNNLYLSMKSWLVLTSSDNRTNNFYLSMAAPVGLEPTTS